MRECLQDGADDDIEKGSRETRYPHRSEYMILSIRTTSVSLSLSTTRPSKQALVTTCKRRSKKTETHLSDSSSSVLPLLLGAIVVPYRCFEMLDNRTLSPWRLDLPYSNTPGSVGWYRLIGDEGNELSFPLAIRSLL